MLVISTNEALAELRCFLSRSRHELNTARSNHPRLGWAGSDFGNRLLVMCRVKWSLAAQGQERVLDQAPNKMRRFDQ